ncbi:MAG: hypothetical protein HPY58_02655 [Firmicutes bacterium]|nr:hypothetical protein [Bacillota bacterium]
MVIRGKAKVDRRTKNLVKRLRPHEIAVIDHEDLDEVAARSLIDCRPRAVVNASSSITGKYPNTGPLSLLKAGIPLIDEAGAGVINELRDGDEILLCSDGIYRDGRRIGNGTWLSEDAVRAKMEATQENLKKELVKFVENTLTYARQEQGLILGDYPVPALRTGLQGRHALIVVRGQGYREDILAIKPYIDEVKPVLVGVDGGADALLELGYLPDLIVGDMDSVSDRALLSGAEIVVHAYPDGTAPGLKRVQDLGLEAVLFPAPGTSEDIALLLAYEKGAELIVAVGTHSNMIDFLEKGRPGMASTFLVRLKVGSILVDAKGVSKLYRRNLLFRHIAEIFLAALIPLVVVAAVSPAMRQFFQLLIIQLKLILRI